MKRLTVDELAKMEKVDLMDYILKLQNVYENLTDGIDSLIKDLTAKEPIEVKPTTEPTTTRGKIQF